MSEEKLSPEELQRFDLVKEGKNQIQELAKYGYLSNYVKTQSPEKKAEIAKEIKERLGFDLVTVATEEGLNNIQKAYNSYKSMNDDFQSAMNYPNKITDWGNALEKSQELVFQRNTALHNLMQPFAEKYADAKSVDLTTNDVPFPGKQ